MKVIISRICDAVRDILVLARVFALGWGLHGKAVLQCSFRYRLDKNGVVRCENCPVGSLVR